MKETYGGEHLYILPLDWAKNRLKFVGWSHEKKVLKFGQLLETPTFRQIKNQSKSKGEF